MFNCAEIPSYCAEIPSYCAEIPSKNAVFAYLFMRFLD